MFKRMRAWWILGAVAVTLVAVAVACGGGGDGDGDDAAELTSTCPGTGGGAEVTDGIITAEDVLRKDPEVTKEGFVEWGWMFELTGPPQIQVFGEVTGDGVKFAVQEINDAGGFQLGDAICTIKLLEHDTLSEAGRTVAITQQLVRDDKVKVIWGPAALGEPEATLITQPSQVLHLCACQDRQETSLTSAEDAQGDAHWAFQTLPEVRGFFLQGALQLKEDFPQFETVAILCVDSAIGQSVCGFYEEAYQEAGFELVSREDFPLGTTDYSPFLTRLPDDVDVLLNFDDAAAQINLLGQALDLEVADAFNTSLPPDLVQEIFGARLGDRLITAGGIPRQSTQPTSDDARDYFERYAEFNGGELPLASFVSLLSYDFVYMLVAAMQQAGTVEDTTAIADALEDLHYDGVAEDDIFFDERHVAVMGSDGCRVLADQPIECTHDLPLSEAER